MGFYASNTHRVVPCENCVLQPESFGDVLTVVREWIIRRGITVYDEQTHKGLLRHVYIHFHLVKGSGQNGDNHKVGSFQSTL